MNGGPLLRLNPTVLTSTSYADYDLSNNGDVLSYAVVAVDTSGNESVAATVSATAAPTFNAAGADPALIGQWSFDEGSGTVLQKLRQRQQRHHQRRAPGAARGNSAIACISMAVSATVAVPDGSWDTTAPKTLVYLV